jgi:hypothetical protein
MKNIVPLSRLQNHVLPGAKGMHNRYSIVQVSKDNSIPRRVQRERGPRADMQTAVEGCTRGCPSNEPTNSCHGPGAYANLSNPPAGSRATEPLDVVDMVDMASTGDNVDLQLAQASIHRA